MKSVILLAVATLFTLQNVGAQYNNIKDLIKSPKVSSEGLAPFRNEFISYNIRLDAEKGDRSRTEHYKVLEMVDISRTEGLVQLSTNVDVPYMWLNRDVFLQVSGVAAFTLSINGESVGFSSDSRCPSQFNISPYITDGDNVITMDLIDNGFGAQMDGAYISNKSPEVFIYSQPKLRIEDYEITTVADTTGKHTIFSFNIGVANSYNSDEVVSVGYDIYSPKGKLLNYDMREMALEGNGRDTLRLQHIQYNTASTLWSEKSPTLYRVMLSVKYKGRLTEYIPLKVGISDITYDEGVIYRNGKPIKIEAKGYNAAVTEGKTKAELKALKKRGVNTVVVDYPQDWWFYDLCDELGVNVIDQANVNNTVNSGSRDIDGSISNDPEWVEHFTERAVRTLKRSNNRTSIIAISLGGSVGNGYNLYKSYQELKQLEKSRPIIFRDHANEWNSDMDMPNYN